MELNGSPKYQYMVDFNYTIYLNNYLSSITIRSTTPEITNYDGFYIENQSPAQPTKLSMDNLAIKTFNNTLTNVGFQIFPMFGVGTGAAVLCYYLVGIYKYGDLNAGYSYPNLG